MPPLKSAVWKYFKRLANGNNVKCTLCETELTYCGGTTNRLNHVKLKHPSEAPSESPAKQSSLASFVTKQKTINSNMKEKITTAIAEMIVQDYLPLSFVEGDGFVKLMNIIVPEYNVPTRNTMKSRIAKMYDGQKHMLISELSSVQSVSLTTDTWTSVATESYITITEHHITDDWKLESNVLCTRAMPERHTGDNIASKMCSIVSEFGLDGKIQTCVHDNARNMECAGMKCPEWDDFGCFPHTLQLCIKPVFEVNSVSKLIAKCRKLVGHFKHSTTITAEMRKRQRLLDVPEHELVQDVVTRWNSTQLMLSRLVEQRRTLTDILLDDKITKKADAALLPKDHEWEIMTDLSAVLTDLTEVTTYMCTEQNVSLSEVYPIVCGLLRKSLKVSDSDSSLIRKTKELIFDQLKTRYQPFDLKIAATTPIMASILDPQYKRLSFLNSEQKDKAEESLEGLIDEIPLTKLAIRNDTDVPPSKRQRRPSGIDFLLSDATDDPEPSDELELQSYLLDKSGSDKSALEWWNDKSTTYPRLSILAKRMLAVPATSVPSERIFSCAGLIATKLRNRLSAEVVDQIIFLNKNKIKSPEGTSD